MKSTILDHPTISNRYFFPHKAIIKDPFWVQCGEVQISCYYKKNPAFKKAVMLFHGNGETVSDYINSYVPLFEKMGLNCFLAEYRGYSMSDGQPELVKMLSDIEFFVQAMNTPPENIIVFGRSIGSLYALETIKQFPTIPALIIESGIADIMDRLLIRVHPEEIGASLDEMHIAARRDFNHEEKINNFNGASLIIHTMGDSLINYMHGENLYKWAPNPKKLKLFESGDHNTIFSANFNEYVRVIKDFLSEQNLLE